MFSKRLRLPRSTAAWRISIWTTLAFAIGTAAAFAFMHFLVSQAIRERSDAWLRGEAEVLASVSLETPKDAVYDRIVGEVAELATREVPDERNSKGQSVNYVFFLQTSRGKEPPLWVGPGTSAPFLAAIQNRSWVPGEPQSIAMPGWKTPFRVVYRPRGNGVAIYLGLSDHGAARLLHRLTNRFLGVWAGMVLLGFVIAFASVYRTLLRVENITATVARIGSDDLSSRLPEGAHGDEISRLSRTFNRMLDRIQASVNQLRSVTGALAHDLKSPVTSIRGSLEVALSDGDHGDWREPVAAAVENLDRLSEFLNTSLDLAEAEAGALQLRREVIDLARLVRQIADLYQPAMAERRHELVVDVSAKALVPVDVPLMNRTLANLLDNELAHLPPGCRIVIRLRATAGEAELMVEDNGPGFPPDLKRHAFERFVKGKQSTGHGLGLAFVDAVVQAHGGRISIADTPGGGALISLSLPLAPVPEGARA